MEEMSIILMIVITTFEQNAVNLTWPFVGS